MTEEVAADGEVVVYWRPGCVFCGALLRGLERTPLSFARRDIWQDEDAAAFVRSVADGNETVPTVRIGDVAMVNPAVDEVLREAADRVPHLLPDGYEAPQGTRVGRAITRLLGG